MSGVVNGDCEAAIDRDLTHRPRPRTGNCATWRWA